MRTIKITQIKSAIDRPERQKLTLRALGLHKMNASRDVVATPQILGMVRAVDHLLRVEAVDGGSEDISTVSLSENNVDIQEPAIFQPAMIANEAQAGKAEASPNLNASFEQESSAAEVVDNPVNEFGTGTPGSAQSSDTEEVVFIQQSIDPSLGSSAEDEAKAIS